MVDAPSPDIRLGKPPLKILTLTLTDSDAKLQHILIRSMDLHFPSSMACPPTTHLQLHHTYLAHQGPRIPCKSRL